MAPISVPVRQNLRSNKLRIYKVKRKRNPWTVAYKSHIVFRWGTFHNALLAVGFFKAMGWNPSDGTQH